TNALNTAVRTHPAHHLLVPMSRGRERSAIQHAIMAINNGGHVLLFVRIDTAYDRLNSRFMFAHGELRLGRETQGNGFSTTDRLDKTVTGHRSGPSRVTHAGEAKPHRKASPGDRQVKGKTHG